MKLSKLVAIALCISGLTSCKKNEVQEPIQNPQNIKVFDDLRASSNFDWSTYKDLKLLVKGIKILASEKNTLTVTSTDGVSVFFKEFHNMSDSFEADIKVPINLTQVKVSFGTISKTYILTSNELKFNYIF